VRSALGQSYRNLEVLVQDDASQRDPTQLLTALHDPRVRVARNAEQLGGNATFLAGCRRATGEYFAILGAGDLWHADFLRRLVVPMAADPDIAVAFCAHDCIDANGRVDAVSTGINNRRHRSGLTPGVHTDIVRLALINRSICAVSAAVYRRSAVEWERIPSEVNLGFGEYTNYLAARTGKRCYYEPHHLAQVRQLPEHERPQSNPTASELVGRTWMGYWDAFYRDQAVAAGKRYFAMRRSDHALRVLLCRLQHQGPRASLRELEALKKTGMFSALSLLYHLRYGKE
jgi:glycosyltransferase involved in cell wall biosynthesis